MVLIVNTNEPEVIEKLSPDQRHWVYNGLDICITAQVKQNLEPTLDDVARKTYRNSLNLQAPFLEMMLRGLRVDLKSRETVRLEYQKQLRKLERNLNRLYNEVFEQDSGFNPRSPMQVKNLLYGMLNIPEVKKRNAHGRYEVTTDRETLEKLALQHLYAMPFINHILAIRDLSKALGFLKTPLDPDGRIRCNFNIAGTNTGRLSSSISDFGTGTNLQNVAGKQRQMFVADKGRKFVEIDLEQADSRNVAALCWNIFYDKEGPEYAGSYLDACESGDLHTTVCRMAWSDLDWGDSPDNWRAVADQIAYRDLSYRDLAKKLGHGTNYLGKPFTMAMHSKVAIHIIEQFQQVYLHEAFPVIADWQEWTIHQLQSVQNLTNLFGRRRFFYGNVRDTNVINAAIAYSPQGSTGEQINIGIQNLWNCNDGKWFRLLVQVHDSILFDIPEEAEDELVPLALDIMRAYLTLAGGRKFHVPLEAKTGWNWGKVSETNKYGLKNFSGHDSRPSWHRVDRTLHLKDYT